MLILFDFACHPCTGSHANLLCILSCLCNAQPEGWAGGEGKNVVYNSSNMNTVST